MELACANGARRDEKPKTRCRGSASGDNASRMLGSGEHFGSYWQTLRHSRELLLWIVGDDGARDGARRDLWRNFARRSSLPSRLAKHPDGERGRRLVATIPAHAAQRKS